METLSRNYYTRFNDLNKSEDILKILGVTCNCSNFFHFALITKNTIAVRLRCNKGKRKRPFNGNNINNLIISLSAISEEAFLRSYVQILT